MRTLTLIAAISTAALACGGHGTRESLLVSTALVASHLNDPNLVVLAIDDPDQYAKEHIPGALRLDLMAMRAPSGPGKLTLELPAPADLAAALRLLGINDDSRIVLSYGSDDFVSRTTRVFLTLDSIGLGDRTALLDGGYRAWKSENRPVTADVRPVSPGKFTPCPQSDVVADLDYVRANLNHPGVAIVDARTAEYYTGASLSGKRPGHIPGAANLTFSTLLDDNGKFKKPDTLAAMFRDAGVKSADRVVSYCHIGQQATVVYFVARYLGYDARLYDGSWEEWSARTELPATLGAKR